MGVAAAAAAGAQALAAVMKSSPGRRRYSAHIIAHGILRWYSNTKQLPRGISPNSASVRDWALRSGAALRKLVPSLELLSLVCMFPKLSSLSRIRSHELGNQGYEDERTMPPNRQFPRHGHSRAKAGSVAVLAAEETSQLHNPIILIVMPA